MRQLVAKVWPHQLNWQHILPTRPQKSRWARVFFPLRWEKPIFPAPVFPRFKPPPGKNLWTLYVQRKLKGHRVKLVVQTPRCPLKFMFGCLFFGCQCILVPWSCYGTTITPAWECWLMDDRTTQTKLQCTYSAGLLRDCLQSAVPGLQGHCTTLQCRFSASRHCAKRT